MRTFQWSRQLMIGHEQIDQDHQILIGLIGDVEELLEYDRVPPEARSTYERFLDFLVRHCAYEEDLMHQLPSLYHPRVSEHCHHHGILINEARQVSKKLMAGAPCPEVLEIFQKTVIGMTRDLIMDDVELVGILLLEQRATMPL